MLVYTYRLKPLEQQNLIETRVSKRRPKTRINDSKLRKLLGWSAGPGETLPFLAFAGWLDNSALEIQANFTP